MKRMILVVGMAVLIWGGLAWARAQMQREQTQGYPMRVMQEDPCPPQTNSPGGG